MNFFRIAFGQTLKELREINSIGYPQILRYIPLKLTYYKTIESGTATLGLSNVFELYTAFEKNNIRISYLGLLNLMLGVSVFERFYEQSPTDKDLWTEVGIVEPRLSSLMGRLKSLLKVYENDNKIYIQRKGFLELIFRGHEFQKDMKSFLLNYDHFGARSLENIVQQKFFNDLFSKVPTHYFQTFAENIEQFNKLPNRFNLNEVIENSKDVSNIYIVVTNLENLLNTWENKYRALFPLYQLDETNTSVNIILLTNNYSRNSRTKRQDILKKIIKRIAQARSIFFDPEHSDFFETFLRNNKIQFKELNNNRQKSYMKELNRIALVHRGWKEASFKEEYDFSTSWIFQNNTGLKTGYSNLYFGERIGEPYCYSLDLRRTIDFYNTFQEMWNLNE